MNAPTDKISRLKSQEAGLVELEAAVQVKLAEVRRKIKRLHDEENSPTFMEPDGTLSINFAWFKRRYPEHFPETMSPDDMLVRLQEILDAYYAREEAERRTREETPA